MTRGSLTVNLLFSRQGNQDMFDPRHLSEISINGESEILNVSQEREELFGPKDVYLTKGRCYMRAGLFPLCLTAKMAAVILLMII